MYIVTGGAGFIGSGIVWSLNQRGIHDILVVDNLGKTEKWRNLVKLHIQGIIHKVDFLPWLYENVSKLKIDGIFHMGACSATTEQDMDYLVRNNFEYSKSLFEICADHNLPYIYASSAATYGNGERGYSDKTTEMSVLRPINRYGYSKKLFDDWALMQTHTPPFWAGLKFFNVYGPQEYHKGHMQSLVAKAVPQIKQTGMLKLFKSYKEGVGHGEQKRDFIYIKDVLSVIMHLFDGRKTLPSSVYNCGTGKARSFADLGRAVFSALGLEANFEWIEMPDTIKNQYQYFTEADLTRLREEAGYHEQFCSLEDGVKEYVNEYLVKEDSYL